MKKLLIALSVCSFVVLSGCASTDETVATTDAERISQLERQLKKSEAALSAERRRAESAIASAAAANQNAQQTSSSGALLPPSAKTGECYARAFVPPVYKTEYSTVVTKEAGTAVSIVPAKYKWADEKVMVEESHTHLRVVPATYKTVKERVLVEPEKIRLVKVAAVYETVTEKVVDKPAHTTWKKGTGPIQKIDEATGEIMCLVDVPATYKTISRRVLKSPATTKKVTTPAVYKTINKTVIATPETTREITTPAKYRTVRVRQLVEPAKTLTTPIPETTKKISRQVKVSEGYMEWRSILCETNATGALITRLQRTLKTKGYNPGPIDGIVGAQTMAAVNKYQRDNNLPVDKHLNTATLKNLGVL